MKSRSLSHDVFIAQRGLTLVEIMVAITIGLILVTGLIGIFIGSNKTYTVENDLARVQENGRMALTLMANDIRMASYWGCRPLTTAGASTANFSITDNLQPGAGYIAFTAGGISGVDGGPGAGSVTLTGAVGTGLTPQPNGGGGTYSLSTSAALQVGANSINTGDFLLVSNCLGGDVFQVTGAAPSGTGVINHAAASGTPGNKSSSLSQAYAGDALIFELQQITYNLQPGSDGLPALFRTVNSGAAQEVVDDVSNWVILYGVDVNGDLSIDRYVNVATAAALGWNNVYSVKVQLTIQTTTANTSLQTGKRVSQNFATTVAIRNRIL